MLSSLYSKLKEYGFFTYGITIPGLILYGKPAPYPVLNERAIRAGAGISLALGAFAFSQAWFRSDFIYLQFVVAFLFLDFLIKVFVGTSFSPLSQIANLIVRNQTPEYVGAVQKRFAWSIGLLLSGIMFLLIWVFDVRGMLNLTICVLCLSFMFLETSFGICVGCKLYNQLLKYGIIATPTHKPVCPGNVCAIE